MENKIIAIREKVPQDVVLPDGSYIGVWGSNIISLSHDGKNYELETEQGVRSFGGINVVVTINDGVATFAELKN
jgi:hypothetical protein